MKTQVSFLGKNDGDEIEVTFVAGAGGFMETMPIQHEGKPTFGLTSAGMDFLRSKYGRRIEAVVLPSE
jgi:hypothetical protein